MNLLLSTALAVCIMFGIPLAIALLIISPENQRRLERARRYRAVHGTPWWIPESGQSERLRRWLDKERERVGE